MCACARVCVFVEEASLPAIKDSCWDTHLIEMNIFLDSGYMRRGVGESGVAAGGLLPAQWLINAP